MNEQPRTHDSDTSNQDPLIVQLKAMAAALWASHQRNNLLMLLGTIVAVVGATAYAQIRLNAWNRPSYNALSDKKPLRVSSRSNAS
jgi:putative ATP-binding cassette transporter